MADWLDTFHDDLWDALPEMDETSVKLRATKQASEAVERVAHVYADTPDVLLRRFYKGYMDVVDDMMSNKELRAQALKEQGRG